MQRPFIRSWKARLAVLAGAVLATGSAMAQVAAPAIDKGDTAWMMLCAALVIFMALPGLALFYGGLVRSKNVLSVLMQTLAVFSLVAVLWALYGYSFAFTEGNAFIGGVDRLFAQDINGAAAATFTKGVYIPELVFFVFQGAFACITCALIIGAFAERVKFAGVLLFTVLWFTFAYLPMAHMVWATGGLLFEKGDLDFAGGTVVHINSGIAALVGALVLGKRIGYGRDAMPPHNLPFTMIGAALLWVGWFGFNAGSNLEATGIAVLALLNTILATAAAALAWMLIETLVTKKFYPYK
mgnify:FL=1